MTDVLFSLLSIEREPIELEKSPPTKKRDARVTYMNDENFGKKGQLKTRSFLSSSLSFKGGEKE